MSGNPLCHLVMQPEQKRDSARNRTLRGGTIVFRNGISTMKCRIRDESHSGFQLVLQNAQGVPDQFYLIIDFEPGRIPCELRWRKIDRVGVRRIEALAGEQTDEQAARQPLDTASLLAQALRLKSLEMQTAQGGVRPERHRLLKRPLAG